MILSKHINCYCSQILSLGKQQPQLVQTQETAPYSNIDINCNPDDIDLDIARELLAIGEYTGSQFTENNKKTDKEKTDKEKTDKEKTDKKEFSCKKTYHDDM